MAEILKLAQGFDVTTIGIGACFALAAALWLFPNLGARLKGFLPTGSKSADHPRVEVLTKLDDVYVYFEKEGCKEGMAAVKTAVSHVYHEHGAPA